MGGVGGGQGSEVDGSVLASPALEEAEGVSATLNAQQVVTTAS